MGTFKLQLKKKGVGGGGWGVGGGCGRNLFDEQDITIHTKPSIFKQLSKNLLKTAPFIHLFFGTSIMCKNKTVLYVQSYFET
jgi:hypothetical protein